MGFAKDFAALTADALSAVDEGALDALAGAIAQIRADGGRLFALGVGGSAAIAAHAVIDLRKGSGVEAYAPTDSMPELSARTNDEGWETVFEGWLQVSRLRAGDALLIFSVGGGDAAKNLSVNVIRAIDLARSVGAKVLGVVGKPTGHTAQHGDHVVVIGLPEGPLSGPVALAAIGTVQKMIAAHPALKR